MREPLTLTVPRINPNDDEAILVAWHVARGASIAEGQLIFTIETTKATVDVSAPRSGFVFFELAPGSRVMVGSTVAWISDDPSPARVGDSRRRRTASERAAVPNGVSQASSAEPDARFTRKALQLMRRSGLVAADFPPSDERIGVEDVERLLRAGAASGTTASSGAPATLAANAPSDAEPLDQSAAKMIEVRSLAQMWGAAVPSTVVVAADCARLDAALVQAGDFLGGVSLLERAIVECAALLGEFPELNAYHDGQRAWHYRSVGIGFAVNLGRGLRVPVVHDPETLSLRGVAQSVRDLSLRYLRDELAIDDLTGGTFTITDLSTLDVAYFVPVLNLRQAAILGLCAPRPGTGHRDLVMTFDHRVTDGMQAARFLGALRERLETPPADPSASARAPSGG